MNLIFDPTDGLVSFLLQIGTTPRTPARARPCGLSAARES